MTYSIIELLAAIILIITNRDAFWPAKGVTFSKTQRLYRLFLLSVLGYYITDGMWGVWYDLRKAAVSLLTLAENRGPMN